MSGVPRGISIDRRQLLRVGAASVGAAGLGLGGFGGLTDLSADEMARLGAPTSWSGSSQLVCCGPD